MTTARSRLGWWLISGGLLLASALAILLWQRSQHDPIELPLRDSQFGLAGPQSAGSRKTDEPLPARIERLPATDGTVAHPDPDIGDRPIETRAGAHDGFRGQIGATAGDFASLYAGESREHLHALGNALNLVFAKNERAAAEREKSLGRVMSELEAQSLRDELGHANALVMAQGDDSLTVWMVMEREQYPELLEEVDEVIWLRSR
jgi:hypothetical protein